MNEVARLTDYSVVIEGETYTMTEIPDEKSKLVQSERKRTLKTIKLDKVVKNLGLTGDLINLAYNSIPSKFGELRDAVMKLQDRFGGLCGKCTKQLDRLEEATRVILPNLSRVFKFLLQGKETTAVKFLQRCSEDARKLSTGMSGLATEFDELGDDTVAVLGSAETARGAEKQKIEELKEKAGEVEALTKRAKTLADLLADAKKKLEIKYEEAKEKAETAEDRAFALSMVSAILKPVAEGLGAVAGAYMKANSPASLPLPTPTPSQQKDDTPVSDGPSKEELEVDKDDAEQKAAEAQDKADKAASDLADAETELEEAESAVSAAQDKVDEAEEDSDEKSEAKDELTAANAAKKAADGKVSSLKEADKKAKKALKKARKKAAQLAAAWEKLGGSVGEAAENVGKIGDSYFALADEYRKEKMAFLKLLMKKEDEERQALVSIQEYAVRMKNIGEQTQTAEVTASALFQAIAALKQVVVVLRESAYFWSNMAEACDRLADTSVTKDIEDFQDLDLEERLELYREAQFKEQVVRYYAGWRALEVIGREYAAETGSIREKVLDDFGTYLDDAGARQKAEQLGGKLLLATQTDLESNAEYKKLIEQAISDTEQEKQAAA